MTLADIAIPRSRTAVKRTVLMCRPDHFTVSYRINPWMHPEDPTDTSSAVRQWTVLYQTYLDLGFDVRLIDPIDGLNDMVYAANGGFVLDGIAYGARFTHPQRQPEGPAYMEWFRANGLEVRAPLEVNEGEGDFLLVGDVILAGTGFRTATASHHEVATTFGREVVSLTLINPSFYHLDTAIAVLDDENIAYLPSAFDAASLAVLRIRFPDAIIVTEQDAAVLGLNSFSDGYNVVIASRAKDFERQLRERGYNPIGVDLSELLLGGGGVKCCTLELRGLPEVSPSAAIERENEHLTHNYHPLPVVVASAEGAWVTDITGRRYLDCLAAYSAVNFGHRHPALVAAAKAQLDRVTLTSRAFHNDRLGPFAEALASLAGKDLVLPMNTGAEAVESAIKVARAWGYRVKGVKRDRATIIVADGNFHGRTTTIVSFSDDEQARADFGPYTPGFVRVPFGDADALEAAIDAHTVAVLLEPIQGEAGIIVPPADYLPRVREITARDRVLFIADEIQSGLGRTGWTFACDRVGVVPDLYLLGKALGGGIVPVSAVVGDRDVLGVLRPGEHGSTFGGNPLAAAVGIAVIELLRTGEPQRRARELGTRLHSRLGALVGHGVSEVRGAGLWAGVDIDPALASGRRVCELLMDRGVLAKDTHGSTIRFAPPLVVTEHELDWAVDQLAAVLDELTAA
jgi:ornithine--oxo-acid transaminase